MEVAQLGGHRDRVVMGDEKGFASFRNQPARQASSANGVTVCASYSPTALALMKVVLKPTTVATACSSTCKDLALLYCCPSGEFVSCMSRAVESMMGDGRSVVDP